MNMHIYEKDGRQYPSVTTIIHCLGNDEITKWANHLGFRHISYEEELDKAAQFGTKVHDVLRGVVDPEHTSIVQYKDDIEMLEICGIEKRFRKFISKYQYRTIETEHTIISEELGYAGTLDWLAIMGSDEFLMLNDFKTSKAVRFYMMLQLGGYHRLLQTKGIEVNGASIILANKKLCSMYPINRTELDFYADAFITLKDYYLKVFNKSMAPDTEFLGKLTTP